MAANRYGRIYHSDHHYINLRFPSVDARRAYAEQFAEYHKGHDHDGEAPRFEETTASTIGNPESTTLHDAHSVSLDGYATYEIEAFHNPSRWNTYDRGRYRPPTCCVPPTLSINRTFIDSGELTRHELSAIFMDMPEEDFQNLLKSVYKEGFKDPVIRMIDEQVLDGWHRYRAAKELNLLRKLRFQQWNEKDEGDPAAFVMARNIERRHLTPGQRAQIVYSFNQRYGHGGDRKRDDIKVPNGTLKTQEELAKEAGVGIGTIKRASQVEKTGRADEVIAGEKSAGEVITEETVKTLWEQINPAISAWKKAREGVGYASKTMFLKATLRFMGVPSDTETDVKVLKNLLKLLTSEIAILETLIKKQLEGNSLWGNASLETSESQETEQPSQTAEEREANTELKRKKQVAKHLWDVRIQAARDYTGDADSDLNLHVTLPELEKGFAKNNPTFAVNFDLAMKCTSETSFNIMWDKIAASNLTLEALGNRLRALQTYAADIRQWERPDWSPDTNYILPLIAAKKAKAETETEKPAETSPKPEPDRNALWDAFHKLYPKWKAKYAESGYKENDLIQAATETELFDALRVYRESTRTGLPTAEEIKDVTDLMKSQSYPFTRRVRDVVREKRESSDADTSLDDLNLPALNSFLESLMYHVGRVEHPGTRDDFSVAVFDALVDNDLTEREQLSILLDCAQSIVTEYL